MARSRLSEVHNVGGIFGSKPSDAHVIWRSGRENDGETKSLDMRRLARRPDKETA